MRTLFVFCSVSSFAFRGVGPMARIRRRRTATNEQDMPCQLRKFYSNIFCVVNVLSSTLVGFPPVRAVETTNITPRLGPSHPTWNPLFELSEVVFNKSLLGSGDAHLT